MASLIKVNAKDNITGKDLLLFSNPNTTKGRNHITIKASLDGFLKRFQHKIIRFNRRGKRAVADVTIYGRHYEVILGCEIESQPAVPLISSGTAKNIS